MKTFALLVALSLLTACTAPQDESRTATAEPASASPSQPQTPAPMHDDMGAATAASATGVVEAVDASAGTITIAHGPVEVLKWPAMTMTFKTGQADVGSIKQGDHVAFEFTSTGMDGTITMITHQ